jgi:hypothetical protein
MKDLGAGFSDMLTADMESEFYSVWKIYSSENHLSDHVFLLYLNSEIKFSELEEINKEHLAGIEGLGDDWKKK